MIEDAHGMAAGGALALFPDAGESPPRPLRESQEDAAVRARVESAADDEIRQFVAQWEALEAERRGLAEQQAEVMAEAKARGYSTKALREVIRLRRMRPEERAEFDAVVGMYRAALDL
jgi:uncharacterized protein (UPF0335 family)